MKKIISKTSIAIVCIILGIIVSIQYKTVNEVVGPGYLPNQKNKELAQELNRLQEQKKSLMNELNNLENKVKKYENEASEESDYVKELSKELLKYRMFAGYEAVEGPGIVITIDDPDYDTIYGNNMSQLVENHGLLLDIISYLNVTGAEAISINGLRYTSFSEILVAGNHLNFNNKPIGVPVEIKAIGPAQDLESSLRITGGIIDLMESYDFRIKIVQKDNITIPRYTEIKEFRYAEPVSTIGG